ncbi:glycosyltransferase [Chondrinema litorale]|uniref:glycosyltransferase n=1 Tax=Chondrinema litorale TaxID=2994555 RepID=UPI002542BBE9|nr:glycosyltransferase [Chondrinema litorale]UZR95780.1 glycosyltransferase [Chondrinema litorale]
MAKHKVLYLSYDGMTDPLGQSQVIPYLENLVAKGYEIHLISFEKPERAERKNEIAHILNHVGIVWHPLDYTFKPPVLSTLYDIWNLRKKVKELHLKEKFLMVHCRSYITALIGQWMKNRFGVQFLFDMRGFFADERVEGGLWNQQKLVFKKIYQFFKKKEKQFFEQADCTVCLTHTGKKIIQEMPHLDGQPVPVEVIPCCADTSHFDPEKIEKGTQAVYKERLKIEDNRFILTYLGSVGTWYMLPEMLDFFSVLLLNKPDAIFLFVTAENPEFILEEAKRKGISPNSIRIITAARSEVPVLLSLADAGIFFIKPVFSKKASSPTKQGEMMSMGLPVICNSNVGDSDYLVKKYNSGIVVEDFKEIAYQEAIDEIDNKGWASPEDIRKHAKEFFDLEKGASTYLSIYQRLIGFPKITEETKLTKSIQ